MTTITPTFPTVTADTIVDALQHLSPKHLPEVLQFIQFLEYKYTPSENEKSLEPKASIPAPRQIKVPTPLYRPFKLSDFKVPQDPDSGMSAIYGTWPGDETDDEILKAVEELS
jgi:hypothetical protein